MSTTQIFVLLLSGVLVQFSVTDGAPLDIGSMTLRNLLRQFLLGDNGKQGQLTSNLNPGDDGRTGPLFNIGDFVDAAINKGSIGSIGTGSAVVGMQAEEFDAAPSGSDVGGAVAEVEGIAAEDNREAVEPEPSKVGHVLVFAPLDIKDAGVDENREEAFADDEEAESEVSGRSKGSRRQTGRKLTNRRRTKRSTAENEKNKQNADKKIDLLLPDVPLLDGIDTNPMTPIIPEMTMEALEGIGELLFRLVTYVMK